MRLETLTHAQMRYNPAINARGDTATDLTELAATILSQGIGQPLLVRPGGDGLYEPVEGGRRYRAIGWLIEQGKVPEDFEIPALIRDLTDAEAIELSLATAVTRVPLNPADEAVSFRELVHLGTSEDQIAAHFGIPTRRVRQRLAIAGLPRPIVEALRQGRIGVDVAEAYTVGRDPKRVLELFEQGNTVGPSWIRSQLTQKRIPATSPEAQFVTLDAYRAAGGAVDEDLFSNNAWIVDGKLLAKLFAEKMEDFKSTLSLNDGWNFVIHETDPNQSHKYNGWAWLEPEGKPNLTKEQKARAAELKAELKRLRKLIDAEEDGDVDLSGQYHDADDELEALTRNTFTPEQRARSGVVITHGYRAIDIKYGVMKPAQAKAEKARQSSQKAADPATNSSPVRKVEDAEADFTAALTLEMAQAMTGAMQRAIAFNPNLAKRALTAALLTLTLEQGTAHPFALSDLHQLRADTEEDFASFSDDMKRFKDDGGTLPIATLFEKLCVEEDHVIDGINAHCLGLLFTCGKEIDNGIRPLIEAFDPDVGATFVVDEDFFKRMPRESIAAALGEAAIPGVTPSKKKKELVEMAVRDLIPLRWLPRPLRTPCYTGPGSNTWSQSHADKTAETIINQQAAE